MQWPKAPEANELEVEIGVRPEQLHGDKQAGAHADDAPNHRRDGEGADNPVVVFKGFNFHFLFSVG
jgi:hypothetical protein